MAFSNWREPYVSSGTRSGSGFGCEPQPNSDSSLLAGTLRGRRPGDLLPRNEAELVAGRALNELRDFKLEP